MKRVKLENLNDKLTKEFVDEKLVFGDGSIDSKIILIGEAPGQNEVKLKKPFVGQAGKYLNEFIDVLKIDRKDLYITNTVKYRPTKKSKKTGNKINRTPRKNEIEKFKTYLLNEIDIISPEYVVTLGNTPLQTLVSRKSKIGNIHGKELEISLLKKEYKLIPLYHPAAVIYRKELKEVYLNDLYKFKELLKER